MMLALVQIASHDQRIISHLVSIVFIIMNKMMPLMIQ